MKNVQPWLSNTWSGLQPRERRTLLIAIGVLALACYWRLFDGVWQARGESLAQLAEAQQTRAWMVAQAGRLAAQPDFCLEDTALQEPIAVFLQRLAQRHQMSVNALSVENEVWNLALSSFDGSAALKLAVDAACKGLALEALNVVLGEEDKEWQSSVQLSSVLPVLDESTPLAFSRLPQWRWFPVSEQRGESRYRQYQTLPEADLDGQLLGVVITPHKAYATLRLSGAAERVFHVGDELRPGVSLEAVEPYRIIINQQGRERQISLPRFLPATRPVQGSAADSGGGELRSAMNSTLATLFSADTISTPSGPGLSLSRLAEGQAAPEGLEPDDVIIAIDGQPLAEVMADPSRWPVLMANTALPVTVLRDESETLVYINATGLAAQLLPFNGSSLNE